MLKKPIDKKYDQTKAYKSNKIIYLNKKAELKKWDELSANQMKLTMFTAAKVKPEDTCETRYIISFKEFFEICERGEVGGNNYEQIFNEARKLSKLGIDYIDEDGDWIGFNWINSVRVSPKKGTLTYKLDESLLPFYKASKGSFAVINLMDFMILRGRYALLLYEYLAMWQNKGLVYQTVKQLKEQLEVPNDKYDRSRNFMGRIVDRAVEEINSKSQYSFKVKMIEKRGKRDTVEGVTFYIEPINKTEEEINQNNELLELLISFGIQQPIAEKLIKNHPRDLIINNIKYAKSQDTKQRIDNFAGFLYKAIIEDYANKKTGKLIKNPSTPAGAKLLANPDCEKCNGEGGYHFRPTGTDDPWQWIPCRCTEHY